MPLRPDQADAVMWMMEHPRGGLFLPMGFGKTLTTLTALQLFGQPRTLVVAPPTVAREVWPYEAEKWMPESRLVLVAGSPAKRLKQLSEDADIYVLSNALLIWLLYDALPALGRRVAPWRAIVIDELSAFKDRRTERFKALNALTNHRTRPPQFVWGLTGTPASDHLMDIWAEMFILDKGESLGNSITRFRDRYFEPDNPYKPYPKYELRAGARDKIFKRIESRALSLGMNALKNLLPEMLVSPSYVTLPAKLLVGPKGYEEFRKNSVLGVLGLEKRKRGDGSTYTAPILADWAIPATSAAALRAKLMQFTAGFVYRDEGEPEYIHDLKLRRLLAIIEDLNGDPVLIFYRFREELRRIQEALPEAVHIKEPSAIDRWNRGEIPVLLAHPASAGHGLNLQHGGHNIVWTSVPDSQQLFAQGNHRLYRPGQTHPVSVNVLICPDTWDARAYDALADKASLEQALLEYLDKTRES